MLDSIFVPYMLAFDVPVKGSALALIWPECSVASRSSSIGHGNCRWHRLNAKVMPELFGSQSLEIPHEGETHPTKTPTQLKAQFAQTSSEQFVQIAPPLSFFKGRRQAERVWENCLCKLFLFGWVGVWVGCLLRNNMPSVNIILKPHQSVYPNRKQKQPRPPENKKQANT